MAAIRSFSRPLLEIFRSEPLFLLGVLLIPFENFWFAPSKGWATVAPLVFFAYCAWNVRVLPQALWRLRKILLFVGLLFGLTSLNFLRYPPNETILFDVCRSLGLGLTFLVSLDLYFRERKGDPGPMLRLLGIGYGISLAVGILQWGAVAMDWDGVLAFFEQISKRSTLGKGRLQFTFTEPSFITMHLFGVILPMLLVFRGRRECRLLWICLIGIAVVSVFSRTSLRLQVDTFLVALLLLFARFSMQSVQNACYTILGALLVTGFLASNYRDNYRVRKLIDAGIYGDDSIASRWFRINACRHGHAEDPVGLMTGHGISNLWVPFRRGYTQAVVEYDNRYRREVNALANKNPTSLLSMPLRLLNEVGLPGLLAILALLFRRRHLLLYALTLYVYLFFDSYAFYTAWLYVFFACGGYRAPPVPEQAAPPAATA